MRLITLDHVYDAAFESLPHATHEEWFEKALFGTCDFLDIALRASGHEAKTLVRNFFASDHEMFDEAHAFTPDVVICREAGRWPGSAMLATFPYAKLICTCSHKVDDTCLKHFSAVFTSFPWFVEHCRSIDIRCEYLPLAFGRKVLDSVKTDGERDIPVAFIGGLGNRTWDQGTKTMAAIAEALPDLFIWHGYVQGSLSDLPVSLQKSYCGELWGADMYRLLMRTKVLINRHGEICKGWANNCRVYEAAGCGCALLNDYNGELNYAPAYTDAMNAAELIRRYLERDGIRKDDADLLRQEVLENHCFENRVPKMISVLESL